MKSQKFCLDLSPLSHLRWKPSSKWKIGQEQLPLKHRWKPSSFRGSRENPSFWVRGRNPHWEQKYTGEWRRTKSSPWDAGKWPKPEAYSEKQNSPPAPYHQANKLCITCKMRMTLGEEQERKRMCKETLFEAHAKRRPEVQLQTGLALENYSLP